MYRRSDGSAAVGFALIAGPITLSFALSLGVVLACQHKVILTQLASSVASKYALADVTDEEVESFAISQLESHNLETASLSLEEFDVAATTVRSARFQYREPMGFEIEVVGYAVSELQK